MSYGGELAGGCGGGIRHPVSRRLYGYWDAVRAGRPAPRREEIAAAALGPILSDTFILETSSAGGYRYRLAGSRLCAVFGRELKGADWLSGWPPRDREALATVLRAVVTEAAAARVLASAVTARGQALALETLLLPLRNRPPGYSRLLGATAPLDTPYWLGARPVVATTLTDLELIWPDRPAPDPRTTPLVNRLIPLRRRRHLALYDGGKQD